MLARLREGTRGSFTGALAAVVALGVPAAFVGYCWRQILMRVDTQLEDLRPWVEAEAQTALQRPVKIGKLTTGLNLATIRAVLAHPENYPRYPLVAEELELGCRPEELRDAGQPWVARVKRATALLSAPHLVRGEAVTGGVSQLILEQPELLVVRDAKGKLNLERLAPEQKTPPDPKQPPFQTEISVEGGVVHVHDFASALHPGTRESNRLGQISAHARLIGPRTLRFVARLVPEGVTKNHLGGAIDLSGTVAREVAPSPERPFLTLEATLRGIDLPYAARYAAPLPPEVTLATGRADAQVQLLVPPGKDPKPQVWARARFQDVAGSVRQPFPLPFHSIGGEAQLDNTLLSVTAGGTVLEAGVRASAQLSLETPTPKIEATLALPQVPLRRVLARVPDLKLPPELSVGPTLRIERATLSGPLTNPTVVAALSGASFTLKGLPPIEQLQARIAVVAGELRASAVTGQVRGGGRLLARARYRFAQPNGKPLGKAQWGGEVEAHLRDLVLTTLPPLKSLPVPIGGRLSADLTGTLRGEQFTGNTRALGLGIHAAGLRFPTLSAQASLQGKRFELHDINLAGPSGAARLTGSGVLGGALALEGNLVGFDVSKVTEALELPGVEGTLSASLSATGTTEAPQLLVRDITVLQPRYRTGRQQFLADAAYVERATVSLTPDGTLRATLDPQQPLRIYHTPAVATLSGTIVAHKETVTLDLEAHATNIELDELLRQASDEPSRFAPEWLRKSGSYTAFMEELEWSGTPKSPMSGQLLAAHATIRGDAQNPTLQGSATLGRCLIESFPLDEGHVAFQIENRNLQIRDLSLTTATGKITGEARVGADGALAGSLRADTLDLKALSSLAGLVDRQVGITGALGATVALSGTKERPRLTVQLREVRPLEVAGLPLSNLKIGEIVVEPELREGEPLRGSIQLPELQVRLGTEPEAAALVTATALRYDLDSQKLGGTLSLTQARFQRVVALLQRGHFDATKEGQEFLKSLYNIPKTIDASAALTGTVTARVTPEGLRDRRANLSLTSEDIHLATESDPTQFKARLVARATLVDETLSLDSFVLTQRDAPDDEPTVLRTAKSWLRLPYNPKAPLEYHVTLDANGVPLELGKLVDPGFPVKGKATITIGAEGTPELPSITASFFANSLLVGNTTGRTGQFNPSPLTVDLLRFQAELKGTTPKNWNVSVSDGLLTHERENVTFEGTVPLNQEESRVAANRPINLSVNSTEGITLKTLGQYVNLNGIRLDGTVRGRVALMGTLNDPLLGGKIELLQAAARFPSPSLKITRDAINPIRSLALTIELAGREIRFPQAELTMATLPPRDPKKTFTMQAVANLPEQGSIVLDPRSVIRIENLEDFTRLFVREETLRTQPKLRGEFDMLAHFKAFQVDADNASALFVGAESLRGIGLEEALSGQFDGSVRIKGPLLTPLISTEPNDKLRLTDLQFRIPRNVLPDTGLKSASVFNPRFDIEVDTQTDARLVGDAGGAYEFRGTGNVQIGGSIASPKIEGVLVPTGGFYKYPLSSPFTVQRGGEIRLTYAKRFEAGQDKTQFDVRLTDVTAEGKVQVSASAVSAARSTPRTTDFNRQSGLSDESLVGKRVQVTARFNGLLQLGETAQQGRSGFLGLPVQLSADANLSEMEILSLLVPYQMLSQFVGNGSQQAARDTVSLLTNNLSGRFLFDPVTRQIQSLFGLDNFSVDYDFNGQATVFFSRRLGEPLDRVTIEVRRSFQTRSGTGLLLPQLYSVNYELLQLRRGTRLMLGASTNEQRDNQFFLRGTLRY